MVGDHFRHDILGARAIGMRAILLRRPSAVTTDPTEPARAPADGTPVIRSLAELPELV
jgi:FMN phosphatase YigB (HAD superfamily)